MPKTYEEFSAVEMPEPYEQMSAVELKAERDSSISPREIHAADYLYAQLQGKNVTPQHAADLMDAIRILKNRELRTKFLPISNTKNDLDLQQRGRHCGRYTMEGTAHDGREKRYARVNCKCWNCQYCGPRKAKKYKMTIAKEAERLHLSRLLTLTLDPKKTPARDSVKFIKACWARFRAQLRKKYGAAPNFICVMEFQHETRMPHLHVLVDRYIEWDWARRPRNSLRENREYPFEERESANEVYARYRGCFC